MKTLFQRLPSSKLQARYSVNPKVNSVLRTLAAMHGHSKLFSHVSEYLRTEGTLHFTPEETFELYQAAKWAQYFKD